MSKRSLGEVMLKRVLFVVAVLNWGVSGQLVAEHEDTSYSVKRPSAIAKSNINRRFCNVVSDWQDGLSGKEICEENGGSFCSSVSTVGEGICRGADGSFCGSITTVAEGICRAGEGSFCGSLGSLAEGICRVLKGSFCSSEGSDKDRIWTSRLKKRCRM